MIIERVSGTGSSFSCFRGDASESCDYGWLRMSGTPDYDNIGIKNVISFSVIQLSSP